MTPAAPLMDASHRLPRPLMKEFTQRLRTRKSQLRTGFLQTAARCAQQDVCAQEASAINEEPRLQAGGRRVSIQRTARHASQLREISTRSRARWRLEKQPTARCAAIGSNVSELLSSHSIKSITG